MTSSTWDGKEGVPASGEGDGEGAGAGGVVGTWAPRAYGARMRPARSGMSFLFTPRICHTRRQKSTRGGLTGVPLGSVMSRPGSRCTAGGEALELTDPSLLLLQDEIGDCYESVTRSVAAAMGAESCHLALYDGARREVVARRPAYTRRTKGVPQYRFPLDASAASSHVIETVQPHLSNDPQSDPLYDPSIKERGVHSVLTAPVQRDGRVVALLYVLNKPGGFTADDARDLMTLAPPVGLALQNVRLYASEKDRRVLNESLLEVSRVILGTPTEDNALGTVLDQMWRVVRYQAAAAVVLEGDELRVAASRGGSVDVRVPLGSSGELGLVLERHALQVLSDAATLLPELGIRGATGRAMAAPLKAKQRVLGALVVVFEDEHATEAREGQLLTTFADNSRHVSPWAANIYAGAIARGHDHQHAIRILARAWARVIYRCWIDGIPYDPERHGNAAKLSKSIAA